MLRPAQVCTRPRILTDIVIMLLCVPANDRLSGACNWEDDGLHDHEFPVGYMALAQEPIVLYNAHQDHISFAGSMD